MRELDHRVKNTLATVQSVADQTLRSSASMDEFGAAFSGRIQALARIHTALAGRRWEGLPMTELVELVVGPYRHHADSVSLDCNGTFVASELVRVARHGAARAGDECGEVRRAVDPAGTGRSVVARRRRVAPAHPVE